MHALNNIGTCFKNEGVCVCVFVFDCQKSPVATHRRQPLLTLYRSANELCAHRVEWCHAPATPDSTPLPDACSPPPRSAGASQSAGSPETSADTKPRAPPSAAAGWSFCRRRDWKEPVIEITKQILSEQRSGNLRKEIRRSLVCVIIQLFIPLDVLKAIHLPWQRHNITFKNVLLLNKSSKKPCLFPFDFATTLEKMHLVERQADYVVYVHKTITIVFPASVQWSSASDLIQFGRRL